MNNSIEFVKWLYENDYVFIDTYVCLLLDCKTPEQVVRMYLNDEITSDIYHRYRELSKMDG